MKRNFLLDSITYFFIVLFLYTGGAKLMDIHGTEAELASSPLIGSFAHIFSWALPIGELTLASLLFIPRWRLQGLYLTATLMTLFTVYVISMLFIDEELSCSCGGIVEALSPKEHLVFNASCVVLSLVAILVARKQESTSSFRWLTNTSTAGLFVVVGWILFTAFTAPAIERTGLEGRVLPSFTLQLPDSSSYFSTADIPYGKPFIMIGFSPTCRHCRQQLTDILQHINEFKSTRVYYVTTARFNLIKTFCRSYKLDKYPNIIVGRDTANQFFSYFKASSTPYTTLYDSKKRLKLVMRNQPNAARLSQLIAE